MATTTAPSTWFQVEAELHLLAELADLSASQTDFALATLTELAARPSIVVFA